MVRAICVAAVLVSLSVSANAKCVMEGGAAPKVVDASTATLEQMIISKNEVATWMNDGANFVKCVNRRGDRKVERVMKKMKRLARNFSVANKTFSDRVAQNPSLLNMQDQMYAQK